MTHFLVDYPLSLNIVVLPLFNPLGTHPRFQHEPEHRFGHLNVNSPTDLKTSSLTNAAILSQDGSGSYYDVRSDPAGRCFDGKPDWSESMFATGPEEVVYKSNSRFPQRRCQ